MADSGYNTISCKHPKRDEYIANKDQTVMSQLYICQYQERRGIREKMNSPRSCWIFTQIKIEKEAQIPTPFNHFYLLTSLGKPSWHPSPATSQPLFIYIDDLLKSCSMSLKLIKLYYFFFPLSVPCTWQ